jgi:hypothetical protein
MKRIFLSGIVGLGVSLLFTQATQAQGSTTFLSNLGDTSGGSNPVGSNSWLAAGFFSGNNPGGYVLNSVQLGMANASGNPSGFTVMICASAEDPFVVGSSLGTLTGSANPSTAGTYTYNAPSGITLQTGTQYYIVLTAGTADAYGAYEWGYTATQSYQPVDGWLGTVSLGSGSFGSPSSWGPLGSYPNYDFSFFALDATPAPEPGVIGLFALGGLLVGFQRWKARSVS